MPFGSQARQLSGRLLGLAITFGTATTAVAQDAPTQSPFTQPSPPVPSANPPPSNPVGVSAVAADPSKAALEDRIRQLESMVKQLSEQMSKVQAKPATSGGPAAPDTPSAASPTPSSMGGVGAPGQSLPPNPPANKRFDSPATLESKKGNVKFGPGFEIRTDESLHEQSKPAAQRIASEIAERGPRHFHAAIGGREHHGAI